MIDSDSLPLSVRNLRLDLADKPVLQSIQLELADGDFLAVVGPNGSGKSSLLRCIAGLHPLQADAVRICGKDIVSQTAPARAELGMAVDPSSLPALLSGRECLELFARTRGLAGVPAETLQLADALRFSAWLDEPVEVYSLGTRQKLGVLLGLIGRPRLLLLDEPLNGLDPPSAWALKQHLVELAKAGCAIVLATHAIELAERHVNRALLLVEGRIRHEWDSAELVALRSDPERSLEAEMVAAIGP